MTVKMFGVTWNVNVEMLREGYRGTFGNKKITQKMVKEIMEEIGFGDCYCGEEWLEMVEE